MVINNGENVSFIRLVTNPAAEKAEEEGLSFDGPSTITMYDTGTIVRSHVTKGGKVGYTIMADSDNRLVLVNGERVSK